MKFLFGSILLGFLWLPHCFGQLTTRVVKENLFIPWEIIYGSDNHIWFTQKNGYICRLEPASGSMDTLYHQPQNVITGEGGMLGMALHPDFINEPYVYVAYMYQSGSGYRKRIVRLTYSNGSLGAEQILIDDIPGASIHNGCRLLIVADKLFITTGDVANTATAQDLNAINGKVLRINLDGSIPADNPVAGSAIWSWGHRNPQGLTYFNNKLYSSEHGANTDDEVNIILPGRNYGWPNVEGFCNTPAEIAYCADSNIVEPLIAWTPTLAVSGMVYYNHAMFPDWSNSLLMTTLKDSRLYRLQLNTDGDSVVASQAIPNVDFGRLRDVTVAPDGKVYIATSVSPASGTGVHSDRIIEITNADTTVSVAEIPKDFSAKVVLYPNPAEHSVLVNFFSNELLQQSWQWSVVNVQGQRVASGLLQQYRFEIGNLSAGVYFVQLISAQGISITKQLVKK